MLAPFTLVFFLFLKLVKTLLWAIWKHKNILGYFRNLGSLRYRNEYCMYGKFPVQIGKIVLPFTEAFSITQL